MIRSQVFVEENLYIRLTQERREYNLNNFPIFRVKCQSRLLKWDHQVPRNLSKPPIISPSAENFLSYSWGSFLICIYIYRHSMLKTVRFGFDVVFMNQPLIRNKSFHDSLQSGSESSYQSSNDFPFVCYLNKKNGCKLMKPHVDWLLTN